MLACAPKTCATWAPAVHAPQAAALLPTIPSRHLRRAARPAHVHARAGSLALLAAMAGAVLLWRRRQRRRQAGGKGGGSTLLGPQDSEHGLEVSARGVEPGGGGGGAPGDLPAPPHPWKSACHTSSCITCATACHMRAGRGWWQSRMGGMRGPMGALPHARLIRVHGVRVNLGVWGMCTRQPAPPRPGPLVLDTPPFPSPSIAPSLPCCADGVRLNGAPFLCGLRRIAWKAVAWQLPLRPQRNGVAAAGMPAAGRASHR